MNNLKNNTRIIPQLIQKPALRYRVLIGTGLLAVFGVTLVYLNIAPANKTNAATPTLSFTSASLTSGVMGALNSVHKFSNIVSGVDAQVTICSLNNGSLLSTIDIGASTTGYEAAFQPYVTLAGGSSGSPRTSYLEWTITFKKAGTNTDTIISNVSATAIDVDGNSNQQEWIEAFGATSYSTYPTTELTITTTATSVKATAPTNDYSGIDSVNKVVMFQMNWINVSSITYRTGGVNRNSTLDRQFSIYFKPFFNTSNPLPVNLLKFEGIYNTNEKVILNWATGSEKNNDYFTIERSNNCENYTHIGQVKGAGNSTRILNYQFIDEHPLIGINYYRLSQTDFNGKSEKFKPIMVKAKSNDEQIPSIKSSPVPFKDYLNVTYNTIGEERVTISLINSSGQKVVSQQTEVTDGDNYIKFENLGNLPNGVYFVTAKEKTNTCKALKVMK